MYSFEWMHCLRPSDFLHGSLQTPWNVEVSLGCRMYFLWGIFCLVRRTRTREPMQLETRTIRGAVEQDSKLAPIDGALCSSGFLSCC